MIKPLQKNPTKKRISVSPIKREPWTYGKTKADSLYDRALSRTKL
jgi:hypothetical protein